MVACAVLAMPNEIFRRWSLALIVFAITLFASAFLLFLVQPMIGKMILPKLGGTPQVWNTCMLFFQTVLLAGYFYTHATTTFLRPRKQMIVHGILLFLPLIVMLAMGRPFDVTAWRPPSGSNPIFAALLLLLTAVVMTIDVSSILNTRQPVGAARLLVLLVCTASLLTLPFAVFNQLSLGRMQASRIAPILILANVGGFIAAWIASQFSVAAVLFVD